MEETSDGRPETNSLLLTEPSPLESSLLNNACMLAALPLMEEMLMTILLLAQRIGMMAADLGTARQASSGGSFLSGPPFRWQHSDTEALSYR